MTDGDASLPRQAQQRGRIRREGWKHLLQGVTTLQQAVDGNEQPTRVADVHANDAAILVEHRKAAAAIAADGDAIVRRVGAPISLQCVGCVPRVFVARHLEGRDVDVAAA